MPLPIRDGNQSLTTLSTILVSNSHIPAHTVVSFGAQAITDIATAVSGVELGPNTLNALENITVTLGQVTITGGLTDAQLRASAVTISGIVTATISGTSSVTFGTAVVTGSASILNFPATQTVTFGQAPVTFGTAVITGSTSILNFPATQAVTFGEVVVTGSTSIIGTPSVTFTQASVTFGQSSITGSVSVLNLPATQTVTFSQAPVTFGLISGTVTANPTGTQTIAGTVTANLGFYPTYANGGESLRIDLTAVRGQDSALWLRDGGGNVPISGTVTIGAGTAQIGSVTASISGTVPISISSVTIGNTVTIAGTVTANAGQVVVDQGGDPVDPSNPFPIFGTVDITALPAGTNRIGVVTIGGGTVTIGAGTAQIGSVTANVFGKDANNPSVDAQIPVIAYDEAITGASVSYVVPVQISNTLGAIGASNALPISGTVTVGNSVTIASLPAISGTVTANTFALQGTAVTTSNFTSTTASTVLAGYNATREVLTIFNEGAGNLHVCAGATCTTIAYQVRLSAGDYYEVPNHQTTITHSAVFAAAGTARVTEVS